MTKVLVVDDDPLIYRLYRKLLDQEGFESEVAENGQVALDKLPAFHADIILLDIMMPTMNGIDMLSKLKSDPATKDIPVVVLTNVSDMGVANQALTRGASLAIVKSETEPEQIIAAIKSVLAKAGHSVEPSKPEAPNDEEPGDEDSTSAEDESPDE